MNRRVLIALVCAALMLLCGLSTRGSVFWLLFWVLAFVLAMGLVSVLWTRATFSVQCGLDGENVDRGSQVTLLIDILYRCPLPMGAIRMELFTSSGVGSDVAYTSTRPYVVNKLAYNIDCPHVGAFASGLSSVWISDVFGLFSVRYKVARAEQELVVLPRVYPARTLAFSPGDSERESPLSRAFEDATMPSDLRTFQQGDELKKVHWKLSMRRGELIVRVYEQPQKPDALLLLDCSPPEAEEGEARADMRDALCESVASIASALLQDKATVRMPLLTEHPVDISASKADELPVVRDALARCAFDGAEAFERVLMLETRRMRRTGATAIFTSRLNPVLADVILRMRRMGPKVRVLVAADPEDEMVALLTTRLMRNDVEVETVEV